MSDTQIFPQNLTGAVTVPVGAWRGTSFGTIQYAAPLVIAGPAVLSNAIAFGSATFANVIGLSCRECDAAGEDVYVTPTSGLVDFPTNIWDGVTGQTGGLTTGANYYLSAATPGKMTTVAPSSAGDFIILLGVARDPTTMILNIQTLGNQVAAPAPILE